MAKLIYSMLASVDGYIEDDAGKFDWAHPSDEVHGFINDLVRPVGTHLYGRRMYEVMSAWETLWGRTDLSTPEQEFADIWHDSDKVVYSRSQFEITTERTTHEHEFNPEALKDMKNLAGKDLSVSGPELAAAAFAAELVDEIHLFLVPTSVGSGKPVLPRNQRLRLELLSERRFGNDTVYLHYRPTR